MTRFGHVPGSKQAAKKSVNGAALFCLLRALPHEFAAMHSVEVLLILSSRTHELADLVEAGHLRRAAARRSVLRRGRDDGLRI
jgi:hypothetical protein